jgi:methionyl-tRNA formyltransferase
MRLDPGLDTGPILMPREIEIGSDETAPELAKRMADLGAPLVAESLIKLERGEIAPIPQDSTLATFAPILTKEHGRIDWSLTAGETYNRIRGLAPWPGAYSTFRGRLCQIWGRPSASVPAGDGAITREPGSLIVSDAIEVMCGQGTRLQLETVQLEGRNRISAREFANGARLASGERFGV